MDRRRLAGMFRRLALVAAAAAGAGSAGAQDVALAERGPQFLFASTLEATPTPLDLRSAPVLRQQISLDFDGVTIADALEAVTRQTKLAFVYSGDLIPVEHRVHLRAGSITVAAALTEILLDANLDVLLSSSRKAALVRRAGFADQPVGSVAGRVTDAKTGSALVGATLVIQGTSLSATTGPDGRYRITDVAPGTYTVRARYIGYVPGTASVAVSADREAAANFALEQSVQQMDELVTTTPGGIQSQVKALPSPITVITAEDIERQRPQAMLDIIRQAVPTAVAFDTPAQPVQTAFSVRGANSLTGRGTLKILVDGVEGARFDLAPVDPTSVERIEVIRGPQGATVYGPDAAGGVVQIFTKRGYLNRNRPRVDLRAQAGVVETPYDGSGGALRHHYTGSLRGSGADVSYNFGAGYTRLEDWLPIGTTSRQSSPSVFGGVRYAQGIVEADLSARYFRNSLPVVSNPLVLTSGFLPVSRPAFAVQEYTNQTYGARITISPVSWWRNHVTLGVDGSTSQQAQTQRRFTTSADTLFTLSEITQQKASVGYNTSVTGMLSAGVSGSLVAGIDYYDSDAATFFTFQALNTQGTIQTSPPGAFSESRTTITNTGYFAQAEVGWRETVFVTASVRADDNSTFGQELGTPVQPRVGLSVVRPLGEAMLKVRGAYGRAIRAPLPGLSFGAATATNITLANPALAPERQRGWDAGIDVVFGDRGSLSLTGYNQIADDLIAFVPVTNTPLPTSQYQNIGRVTNRGVEIEGTLNLHPVRFKAQYGYVRSRIEELGPGVPPDALVQVGDRPAGLPAHTAGAALAVSPAAGTTIDAGITYVGGFRQLDLLAQFRCFGGTGPCQPTFRDYVVAFPAFTKINLAVSQRLSKNLDGVLSIDNLTNSDAHEGSTLFPVMGRLTMVGLHFRY